MKKLLAMMLCLSMLLPSALAAAPQTVQNSEVIWYEDGSYAEIVTTISFARSTLAADKDYTYKNSSGKKVFSYTLHGEFDSTTTKATRASGSATIYMSGWSLSSHDEYCSGSTAYGDATFDGPNNVSRDVSLSLTCDKNGNIT